METLFLSECPAKHYYLFLFLIKRRAGELPPLLVSAEVSIDITCLYAPEDFNKNNYARMPSSQHLCFRCIRKHYFVVHS